MSDKEYNAEFLALLKNAGQAVLDGKPLGEEKINASDLQALRKLAYTHYQNGAYEKALQLFTQLVISYPLEANNWFSLASSAQMLFKYEKALIGWMMCSLFNDQDPLPHFHAAECLISIGKIDEAKKALSLFFKHKANAEVDAIIIERAETLQAQWENKE